MNWAAGRWGTRSPRGLTRQAKLACLTRPSQLLLPTPSSPLPLPLPPLPPLPQSPSLRHALSALRHARKGVPRKGVRKGARTVRSGTRARARKGVRKGVRKGARAVAVAACRHVLKSMPACAQGHACM